MAITYHPDRGSILVCDFRGFCPPEMTKRRPVIVISPEMKTRPGLCTVVALSTTPPSVITPYHCKLIINPPLPYPYSSPFQWLKGDMVYSVSFQRLDFLRVGKDKNGKRIYDIRVLNKADMETVQRCVLSAMGIHN